jgi:lambda family phage tail tape measure protein
MDEKKIQLIFEALNKTKGAFTELENSFKGLNDGTKKNQGFLNKLRASWLEFTAATAGAAVAVKKAWDYMELGARAEQAEESFRRVAASIGENADSILADMKRVSAGTVDDSDIMQKAVKGMMQGLSGDQIVKILEAARIAARVSGQDIGQAFETITDAIANKMPRSLIQYGLITKEQMKLFNAALQAGIEEADLFGLVMDNAAKHSAAFGDVAENNAEKMQKWKVAMQEWREGLGKVFNSILNWLMEAGATIERQYAKITANIGLWVDKLLNKVGLLSDKKLQESLALVAVLSSNRPEAPGPPAAGTGGKPASGGGDAETKMRNILAMKTSEAAINQQILNIEFQEKTHQLSTTDAIMKRLDLEKALLDIQEESLSHIDKLQNPQGWIQQAAAVNATRKTIGDLNLALMEQSTDILPGIEEGFKRYLQTAKTAFQQGIELAQQTAQAMEQAFSDFFFDAMTGKLKSFWSYIKSFLEAVVRAMANVMAQQAAAGIFSGLGFGASAASGPAVSPYGPAPQLHSGGLIMHAGGYVPRFHIGGLSSDERAAILQTGEYVVSRKGVAALDRINEGNVSGEKTVVVQIENKSSQVNAKQTGTKIEAKQIVVGIVLEDIEGNGPIRSAITSLGGR